MIDFFADIVNQALAMITCSCAAMLYRCQTSIDSIYGFWTQSPTEIRKIVAWLLGTDKLTCSTNVREVSSKFSSCSIFVWTINPGAQFQFAAIEIVDHIHQTYFYGIQHMGMRDTSSIDTINPTFTTLTAKAVHHCLSAWKTGKFRVPPEFGPGGGAQPNCNTKNVNLAVNTACPDVFRRCDEDFRPFSPEVQGKKIDTICSMIHPKIHATGIDPAMAQPHNDEGSFDEDFHDYVLEEPIE